MPSTRLRPGRPTFYLDTSTLSYAFRGGHPAFRNASEPDYSAVFGTVERISREANLCLSTMHIAEMAQGDLGAVHATFAWLDSLDIVWAYSFDKIGDQEDGRALQLAVGATPHAEVQPFAPSLLAAFDRYWKHDTLAHALRQPSPIEALAEAARERGQQSEHGMIDEMVSRFHYDRHKDPATALMTDAEKRAEVERKHRAMLRKEAERAWQRLRAVPIPQFHERYRTLPDPGAVFADFVIANPTAMPSTFVGDAFSRRFAEVMAGRTPGGGGAKRLRSMFYDYAHMGIGAAYCDVFTCDGPANDCLGEAPDKIGRARPIVYRGDVGAFVAALGARLLSPCRAEDEVYAAG